MENKIRYLEMIQGIISRMANNSFLLKGWAVTLVAGIFTLASKDADKLYFIIAYIPIVVFWGLDSYYLLQERLYRSLYEKASAYDENNINFSLKATSREFGNEKNNYLKCLTSKTELCFYLPLAIVCAVVIVITSI